MSKETDKLQKDIAEAEGKVAELKEKLRNESAKNGKQPPVEMIGPGGRVMMKAEEVEARKAEGWRLVNPPIDRKPAPEGKSKRTPKKKEK